MAEPADLDFCYLTTVGRTSGRPHRIEIWFALREGTVYLLSGGGARSDWVKNLVAHPEVDLEIGGDLRHARARVVQADTPEDATARQLLLEKYATGRELEEWGRTSLPIAIGSA